MILIKKDDESGRIVIELAGAQGKAQAAMKVADARLLAEYISLMASAPAMPFKIPEINCEVTVAGR